MLASKNKNKYLILWLWMKNLLEVLDKKNILDSFPVSSMKNTNKILIKSIQVFGTNWDINQVNLFIRNCIIYW